ncbi:phosphoribosyl-dephospho-CoA transferase MdcG domain-containing protein [Klebsiella quasipneumoniae]|uniref:phosphoribosyl-dephospho-CoA transferase MdcG domain-containing protein n=1 Tax=Klebsiella quasipneumoniae TaxID=1463165 RepID=UPI0015DC4382|nr:phosphoribosyl-dephospho-CoA transferase MdcG domain-containing protein [Klebsiella quasipneumoniae]BBQ65725.1 hypothetical protein WP3W18C02_05440 [Klebsiella quasipneumoniae]BBR13285.1 hypothetical protein WP3S18E03_05430 [Klebsiella quasipneumoniae]
MSALQRHTLCWLDSAELRLIARQLNGAFSALPASWREEARDYLLSGYLPGIVRRGIRDEVSISLGFCFPQRWQGQRLRLATVASLQAVTRVSTPEQTATLPAVSRTSASRAFNALRQAWRGPETGLGVWGVGGAGDGDALAMDGQSLRFRYSHYALARNGVKRLLLISD